MRVRVATRVVMAVLSAMAVTAALTATAGAIPMDPLDPPDLPPDPEETEGPYEPPAAGFTWSRSPRFGSTTIGSFHWDRATSTYDSTWVNPPGGFPVQFNGCAAPENTTGYTYTWEKALPGGTYQLLSGPSANCDLAIPLPEGSHTIRMTITGTASGNPAPVTHNVPVNDILIVSIGDSYGSGEGNPDIRKSSAGEAIWVDERCHRSGYAGPAQAAKQIELHDPASTVTFLSFACSGATVERFYHQPKDATRPYVPDTTKPVGSGVLGTYAGADGPGAGQDEPDYANHLPPQIKQVKDAVGNRKIDAFIISGGGNDIGFGPVATVCVLVDNCKDHPTEIAGTANKPPLKDILAADIAKVPPMFDRLAPCLQPGTQPCKLRNKFNTQYDAGFNLGLNPSDIYVTEYPNQIKDDDGTTCAEILEDVVPFSFGTKIDRSEANWAGTAALGSAVYGTGLNGLVKGAADKHGWNFVGGVAAPFAKTGEGHGYCADDNWIRRADESDRIQGGGSNGTKGTLHPNERGHQVYRDQLLAVMMPRLLTGPAPDVPPVFSTANTVGDMSARMGKAAWLTGRCSGTSCYSDWSGITVTVADPGGIFSVTSSLSDAPLSCAAPPAGMTCDYSAGNGTASTWTLRFTNSGMYLLEFAARGVDGQVETFTRDVKVDLRNPGTGATRTCTRVDGLCRSAVKVKFTPTDPRGGSGVSHIEYRLDGAALKGHSPSDPLYIKGLGTHTLKYRTVDVAGRRSAEKSFTERIVAPTTTTLSVARSTDLVTASGVVDKRAVAEQKMQVSIFRMAADGSWKRLETRTPTLIKVTAGSKYVTKFTRPRSGSCKVTAKYPGEDRFLASSATKLFSC